MVYNEIHIRKYDWRLRIYYAVQHYHTEEIIRSLIKIKCPDDIMNRVFENLQKSNMDSGFTYSNKSLRETVMVIGIWSDKSQFLNSFEHELRHMVDDIGDYYGMNTNGEEIAYLTGDINQALAQDVKLFMCECTYCHTQIKDRIY